MKKIVFILGLLLTFQTQATLLTQAVKKENVLAVKSLTALGAKVDKKDKYQSFPLLETAINGNVQIAKILLKAGANVNLKDGLYRTSLSVAAFKNHPEIMQVLLAYKADPNITDKFKQTALLEACAHIYSDGSMEKMLLAAGANPNLVSTNKISPLMEAAQTKKTEIFNLLIEKNADVNARDKAQKPVLAYAEESDEFKTILLKKGAFPYRIDELNFLWDIQFSEANKNAFKNYRNQLGENHLTIAIKNGLDLAIAPLLSFGIDVNSQDKTGKAAIHWATLENNLEAVLDLIEARAKLKIEDNEGITALEYALMEGNVEIAAILAIAILNEELE